MEEMQGELFAEFPEENKKITDNFSYDFNSEFLHIYQIAIFSGLELYETRRKKYERFGPRVNGDYISIIPQEHIKNRRYIRGLCPYHNERTPSILFYKNSQMFKCYGCGKEGIHLDLLFDIHSNPLKYLIDNTELHILTLPSDARTYLKFLLRWRTKTDVTRFMPKYSDNFLKEVLREENELDYFLRNPSSLH